jgi:hypothetical protein
VGREGEMDSRFKIQNSRFKKPEIPNLPVVPLAGID